MSVGLPFLLVNDVVLNPESASQTKKTCLSYRGLIFLPAQT
ncbi:hypothetical protein ENTCAN_08036 [Enterobacter cancerogenus ATCC 35316]|nr:hypothetical protein ENTCAN_08036 [Enterobacter cancerogenus ATCC 35316]